MYSNDDNDSYGDDNDDDDYYDDDHYSMDYGYEYDDTSILSFTSFASTSSHQQKSSSWDYDSDDEYFGLISSSEPNTNISSTAINATYNHQNYNNNMNDPRDTPPHERAFDRVITILLNQSLDDHLATFFMTTFGRKDVRDIALCNPYQQSNVDFLSLTRDKKTVDRQHLFF